MKKIVFLLPVVFAEFMLFSCTEKSDTRSFTAMNTFMTVKSFGRDSEKANKEVQEEILRLEQILSTTIETSAVHRLNTNSDIDEKNASSGNQSASSDSGFSETKSFYLPEELFFLIKQSRVFYEKTSGAFNPSLYPVIREWGFTTENYRIPSVERINELLKHTDFTKLTFTDEKHTAVKKPAGMQLDFGAVGKGYAGDRAAEILKKNGIKSAILDFGGNIQTIGNKPDGSAWTVGIKNPWAAAEGGNAVACGVKIRDKAVITSGGYERFFIGEDGKKYIHIFDGKTGRPVENDLESVTIICEKGLYGDALSTSLFVMGKEKAVQFWKENRDFDFILITKKRELLCTKSIKDEMKIIFDFENISIVE